MILLFISIWQVLGVYNSIPGIITDEASAVIPDIIAALDDTKTQLSDLSTEFSNQLKEVSSLVPSKNEVSANI